MKLDGDIDGKVISEHCYVDRVALVLIRVV